jgi:purine nucleosidase
MPRSVILDVDTGIDDALAILLALRSPELDVVGLTCVAGNVTLDHVVRNTLAVVELAGSDVPVAVGARKPLMAQLRTATFVHGTNGIGDVELPWPSRRPVAEDAASFLTGVARERPGEVTIVAVGPLTNLALAILQDADFARNVAGLVIMGGAVNHAGNATIAAEANFSNDPEAAAAVLAAGANLQLVDLGATMQALLPLPRLDPLRGRQLSPVPDFAVRVLDYYGQIYLASGAAGPALHDPLAVALAAVPELASFAPFHLAIETAGVVARGATFGNFSGVRGRLEYRSDHRDFAGYEPLAPNASLARGIDADRFLDLFLQRLELI